MEGSCTIPYFEGLLVTLTALLIWFYSPLKVTLGQLFIHKNLYTDDQVETAIMIKNKWLGKLLSCYICFSFWTSLLVGAFFKISYNLPYQFIFLTWFTYPSLCYLYKSIIDRKS
jgi:hypothetical protein